MKVEIDGIVYKLDTKTLIASVENAVDVEGDVVLPSFVEYQEMSYCVKNIEGIAFLRSQNLISIVIPEGVESLGHASFKDCSNLVSITLPSSLCSIETNAFDGCTNLKAIVIPEGVKNIGLWAFRNTPSLTFISVHKDNSIYDSREDCNAIIETATNILIVGCQSTLIPNGIKIIGENSFDTCTSLSEIVIPSSIKTIQADAFYQCTSLSSVVLSNGLKKICERAFQGCWELSSVIFPHTLSYIGEAAFVGCVSLTSITIPSKVTYIGDEAFVYCYSLESLVVDDGNPKYDSRGGCNAIIKTSTNTLIVGCKSTIILDSITTLGISAFGGCSDLTSIKIPNSIVRIERLAFKDCDNLREVTIPEGVKFIGDHCFYECRLLSSITIPSSVVKICPQMTELTSLTSIVVEKENPKYDSRGGCNAIIQTSSNTLLVGCKTTTIPNDVKCIGHSAFSDVKGLKSITIPNGVKKVEAYAFHRTDLKEVIISKSVKKIGDCSFFACAKLNTIIYEGTIQQWKKIEKGEDWDLDSPIKIICCIDGDIPHILNLDPYNQNTL